MLYMKLLKTNKTKLKETKIPSNKKNSIQAKINETDRKRGLTKKITNVFVKNSRKNVSAIVFYKNETKRKE